jgi:hypothetical protein
MARPHTHGPPVTVRLPLDVHQYVEERAQARGETVPAYLVRNIGRWWETEVAKREAKAVLEATKAGRPGWPAPALSQDQLLCEHKSVSTLPSGITVCLGCDARKGLGAWWGGPSQAE